jgi:hypothetical protein
MYTIDTIQYNTMAKYATRRSYKKRASKKRHTIRKLKKTMRRKMQRGGVDAQEAIMIKFMLELMLKLAPQVIPIILSLINLGNVELLMSIIKLLSGNTVSVRAGGFGRGSGSNKRQRQRGGGSVSEKLDELATKFESKPDVVNCINTIKARIAQQSEPAAPAAPAALDSSAELASSLQTELTTDTNITASDTVDLTTDPALTQALETQQGALETQQGALNASTSVESSLPPAVEEAAKASIINKMIEFFNNRIKNTITAKIDSKISNLKGKVGGDVIECLGTLKTAIVEDIVTQIKSKMSQISNKILSGIGGVLEGIGRGVGAVIPFLVWSAVQMARGNYGAIVTEGRKQLGKLFTNVVGAAREKVSQGFAAARENIGNRLGPKTTTQPVDQPGADKTQSQPSSVFSKSLLGNFRIGQ